MPRLSEIAAGPVAPCVPIEVMHALSRISHQPLYLVIGQFSILLPYAMRCSRLAEKFTVTGFGAPERFGYVTPSANVEGDERKRPRGQNFGQLGDRYKQSCSERYPFCQSSYSFPLCTLSRRALTRPDPQRICLSSCTDSGVCDNRQGGHHYSPAAVLLARRLSVY